MIQSQTAAKDCNKNYYTSDHRVSELHDLLSSHHRTNEKGVPWTCGWQLWNRKLRMSLVRGLISPSWWQSLGICKERNSRCTSWQGTDSVMTSKLSNISPPPLPPPLLWAHSDLVKTWGAVERLKQSSTAKLCPSRWFVDKVENSDEKAHWGQLRTWSPLTWSTPTLMKPSPSWSWWGWHTCWDKKGQWPSSTFLLPSRPGKACYNVPVLDPWPSTEHLSQHLFYLPLKCLILHRPHAIGWEL